MEKKKIVVTGGGGFIGSHLVDRLVAQGHDVKVIDCDPKWINPGAFYLKERIETFRPCFLADVVFHLAAEINVNDSNPKRMLDTNVAGSLNMLQEFPGARFVFTSSCAAKDPGSSMYANTKAMGEDLVRKYSKDYAILRLFNVYGPRQVSGAIVPSTIFYALRGEELEIFGGGKQVRDFIFVDDVVNELLKAAELKECIDGLEVGSGKLTSVDGVVGIIHRSMKYSGYTTYHTGENCGVLSIAPSVRKCSKVSLKRGLEKTILWARIFEKKMKVMA